jgi:hypothetical protein
MCTCERLFARFQIHLKISVAQSQSISGQRIMLGVSV